MMTVEQARLALATEVRVFTPEGDAVVISAVDSDAALAEVTGSLYSMRHWMKLADLSVNYTLKD